MVSIIIKIDKENKDEVLGYCEYHNIKITKIKDKYRLIGKKELIDDIEFIVKKLQFNKRKKITMKYIELLIVLIATVLLAMIIK
jgi:hypothetical protein